MSIEHMDEDEERWNESGGSPPKRLTSAVLEEPIMLLKPGQPVTVEAGSTIAAALDVMRTRKIGCVLVTKGGVLTGIFTERDVMTKVVGKPPAVAAQAVDTVATPNPEALTPKDKIAYALHKMAVGGYRHVPLVDEKRRPVGVVSMRAILCYIADYFPGWVLNLPPDPEHAEGKDRDGG